MFSNFKKRLGVLTAIAVMAALVPALVASPASAAASTTTVTKGDTTKLSACPASASIASAGFTDTTSTDVDCIKYYGVTTGVTATTYEPAGTVTRETMALFLTRLATAMGVTLGTGADPATDAFTDLPTAAASQTAINQLKALGVTAGTTATTYSPDDNVTREQMAMFIDRLLAKTAPGANGISSDTATTNISGNGKTYNFTDIDTGVTYEGHNSIVDLYHLGVDDSATGATTYRPSADITRAEMATFMTNAMAHSNARPAGLVLQATHNAITGASTSSHELHVSHRAAAGSTGTEGTLVDMIAYTATTTADVVAFAATGVCSSAVNAYGGSTACKIDVSDNATGATGNFEVDLATAAVTVAESGSVQYWAWTAATGTSYVDGTSTASTTTVTSSAGGDFARWSTSNGKALTATGSTDTTSEVYMNGKNGSDITVSVQLQSAQGVSPLLYVAQAGCKIAVQNRTGAFGSASTSIVNSVIVTDAAGVATFTASKADPTTGDDAATHQVITFTNPASSANTLVGCTEIGNFRTGAAGTDNDARLAIKWDDTARAAEKSTTAMTSNYVSASGLTAGASNTVSATVWDQYGVGVASTAVGMTSAINTATVSTFTVTRTTNASGVATFGVNRVSAVSGMETFTANTSAADGDYSSASTYWVQGVTTVDLDGSAAKSSPNEFLTGAVYGGAAADGLPEAAYVVADVANDTLIADLMTDEAAHTYVKYTYDSNDQFTVGGVAKTMAQWETALGTAFPLGMNAAGDDWGNGGYAYTATPSYVSSFSWAG